MYGDNVERYDDAEVYYSDDAWGCSESVCSVYGEDASCMGLRLLYNDNKVKMAGKKQKENTVGCTGEGKR